MCGGIDDKQGIYDGCYRYSAATKTWTETGWMSTAKRHLAASVHPRLGLITTGGHSGSKILATVETTRDGKNFDLSLPDMPIANHAHCQVTVDSRTVMVLGGCIPGDCESDVAFKLDLVQKKWTKLPGLAVGRHGHSCGVVSKKGVPKKVVVAGGYSGKHEASVEVLDLATLTWSTGTYCIQQQCVILNLLLLGVPLPGRRRYASRVQFEDTFVVVGGYDHGAKKNTNTLLKYEPASGRWTTLPDHLSAPSQAFVAFSINREAFASTD